MGRDRAFVARTVADIWAGPRPFKGQVLKLRTGHPNLDKYIRVDTFNQSNL